MTRGWALLSISQLLRNLFLLQRPQAAFTLIEVVVVVVIIASLGAIGVITWRDHSEKASAKTAASIVRTVRQRIQVYRAQSGDYPPTIEFAWFGDTPLCNPWMPDHPIPVHVANAVAKKYPNVKHVRETGNGAFWYNRANGRFLIRVKEGDTDAETIERFNAANQTSIKSLTPGVEEVELVMPVSISL
ncbi:MAG: type II secretion system protein [Planctomycetota bacterium]